MPDTNTVQRALELIDKGGANYEYFFNQLDSPCWIKPLLKEGFFKTPPEPKLQGEMLSIPIWPESRYLARMAGKSREAAEQVLEIAQSIRTENVRVHEDFGEAALAMPPDLAAKWAQTESKWISGQERIYLLLPDIYGKLISYLAVNGEVDTVLRFAEELLRVLPDPDVENENQEAHKFAPIPKPRVRLEGWHYGRILEQHMPSLVQVAGLDALKMLGYLLQDAIKFEQRNETDTEDYFFIWRKDIGDDSNRFRDGFKNPLVSAIRDGCVQLAEGKLVAVQDLVAFLEGWPWPVLRRIALHLLRVLPNVPSTLVQQRLICRSSFDNDGLCHEYSLLLKEWFGRLTQSEQAIILGYIEAGPQWKPKDDEDYQEVADKWRRDWLSLLVDHLPADWQSKYEDLVSRLGRAYSPDHDSSGTVWAGPTSPKTEDEVAAMTVHEIVDYLLEWEPERGVMMPSPKGLGRVLEAVVTADPAKFAAAAQLFQRTQEPTYISAVLRGLRQGLTKARTFVWAPVCELALWAVKQPREIPGRTEGRDGFFDPNWGWTRQSIASLLEDGFCAEKGRIPLRLREKVWELLKIVIEDVEPTLKHEAEYGGVPPPDMSINTVRGVAMHAVIRYALWVREYLEKRPDGEERLTRGFGEMPEVQAVLDKHLDPSHEPSVTVRAVYGWWLPQLVLLDEGWVKDNLQRIFPREPVYSKLRDSAWQAYLRYGGLYSRIYELLRDEYREAMGRVGDPSTVRQGHYSADERLAEHLMTIYWWGKIGVDELDEFFRKGSAEVRGHALQFIGQSIAEPSVKASPENIDRLTTLWEWRMSAIKKGAKQSPREELRKEISHFGWWFISGRFPESWAIQQLRTVLQCARWAEPDDQVVKHLAELAAAKPAVAVECLSRMAEGDIHGWGIGHTWREAVRSILRLALDNKEPEISESAEILVNKLGQRGFLQYRDLLTKK